MLFVAKLKLGRQKEILSEKFSRTSSVSRILKHIAVSDTSSTFHLVGNVQRQIDLTKRILSVVKLNFSRQKEILSVKFSRTLSVSRILRRTVVFVTLDTFQHGDKEQRPTVVQFVATFAVPWVVVVVR
jgi:hypothetical protein